MDRLKKIIFVIAVVSFATTGCTSKSGKGSPKRIGNGDKSAGAQAGGDARVPHIPVDQSGGNGSANKDQGDRTTLPQPGNGYGKGGSEDTGGYGDDYGQDDSSVDNGNYEDGEVTMLGQSNQCGAAHKVTEPEWIPGTLYPPAQTPILTGGISPRGFQFSDSHDDSVMAVMVKELEKYLLDHDCIEEASKELAARISDVDISTDIYKTGTVKAKIELYDGSLKGRAKSDKERIIINLTGELDGHMNASRRSVKLVQTNKAAHGLRFEAQFACLDADRGCQTTVIRLMQKTKNNETCRVAYIIQRFGNAHVTMDVEDRLFAHRMHNRNHGEVAQYLSNTANVSCMQTLDAVRSGARGGMPMCAIKRLEEQCDGTRVQEPYARVIGLKTWSVLYGAAKFRFFIDDALTIEGPLVSAPIRPVFDHKLTVGGGLSGGIQTAYLMNNDGAGQLNFELNFFGGKESRMRFSVTSILKDNALAKESVMMTDVDTEEKFVVQRDQIEPLPGSAYDPSEESAVLDDASATSRNATTKEKN